MGDDWASAARNGRPYEHVLGRSRIAGLALWPALVGVGLGLTSSSFAFTITETATAPAANLLDSQLDDATGAQDNNRNFTDNGGPPGQTFTLDTAGSFQMTGFTLQGRGDAGGGALTADWSIQLGTVDPVTGEIASLLTETSTVALAANNNYITFNFDAPLTITGGVQYAFSVYSSVGWYGFAHSSTDVYDGGFAFSNNTSIDNPGNNAGGARRTFNGFVAPDPGAYDYVFAVQGFALGAEKIWSGQVGGVANGTWNTTLTNFSGNAYTNGDSPVFGDFAADGTTPVTTRNITIQPAGVTPTSVKVENSNGDYTFDGAIRNAPLTKTGTSALTLSGSTDNTGLSVNHNQGTLRLAKASSATVHAVENLTIAAGATAQVTGTGGDQISNTGAVTVNGTLDLNGASEAINGLSGTTGTVTNDGGGAVTLTIGASGGDGSFTGTILDNSNATAGTIALVKTGAGTIALNGANTYTGGTRIEGGTLALGADYAQAQTATLGTGPVTVTGGGQLRFGGIGGALQEFTFPNAITLDNGTLFANDGLQHVTGTVTVASGGGVLGAQWGGKDLSLEGGLAGSGALTITQVPNNGGAVLLATNNSATYSGAITIQNPGILRTVVAGALGTGNVTVDGTLDLLSNSQTVPLNGGTGTIAVGDATLTVPAGTFSGAITSGAAGRLIIGGGTLILTGAATVSTPTISLQPGSTLDASGTDTGGITMGAQNLNGTGTIGGTLQTNDGTSISPGVGTNSVTGRIGTINIGTVTLPSSLTINPGTTLNYVLGTPGTNTPGSSSLISVRGDLILPSTGVNVNFIDNANADGLGSLGNGLYRLFAYTGSLIGFEPDSTFAGPEGRSYTFSSTAATNGALDVRISTLGLSWTGLDNGTGAANSLWTDAVATKNWANESVATNFANGVSVTFADTNAVTGAQITNGNVQVKAGGVSPASVVFDNAAVNYVLTSADATGIAGSASIVKHGTGTVTLNGANTYTGATTLNGGLVRLGNPNALGSTSTVQVGELATLDINGQNTRAGALTGGGTVTNDAAGGTATLTVGNTDLDGVFSGVIEDGTGTVAVVKTGVGTQVLNGANTYSGGTTINGGTLGLGADYAQADDAALGTGPVTVTGAAQLRFGGIGGALREFTIPNPITLNDGTLFANDGLQHLTGGLTVSGDGGRLGAQWDTKNLSIEGTITGSGPLTIFQQPANGGRVIFAADNRATYSGAIAIELSGILETSVSGALGTGPVTVDGTLALAGSEQTIASLEGVGTIALGAGTLTVEEGSFSGIITGTGGLTKSGPSTVLLSGASTYTGNTNVTEGILEVTELGELYNVEYTAVPVVNVSGGATLRVAGWQFNEPGSLGGVDFSPTKLIVDNGVIEYTGAGNVPDNSGRNFAIGTGGATLRASGTGLWTLLEDTRGDYNTVVNDSSLTLEGAGDGRLEKPIVGAGSLTKRGTGTWTVSGQNSYFGPTAVEAGTLMVSGAINGTSGVTVANTARLGGGGVITTFGDGSVTVAAGGKLVPGDGLGTLSFDLVGGSLDISAGVATQPGGLVFELDTPDFSDRIAILTGKLNIGTDVLGFEDFSFLAQQGFAPGVYTLFESEEPIVGSLAANREGVINGMIATLGLGDNNQDITLTVIPEPTTALTLMAGMGWLLGLQKFRRRSRSRPMA